jgi:adenine-specific DNA-methyltransferase
MCLDALDAARKHTADVAYIDPPYNQHSYLANYHIWESLVLWDKPEVYGVACKRVDVRERKSAFNSRPKFKGVMEQLLASLQTPVVIVSFNNEGYLDRTDLESMLATLWDGSGTVVTIENDFKRYVGAQIGIHNPKGEKVGTVSHLRNKEFLYVAARDGDAVGALGQLANSGEQQLGMFDG